MRLAVAEIDFWAAKVARPPWKIPPPPDAPGCHNVQIAFARRRELSASWRYDRTIRDAAPISRKREARDLWRVPLKKFVYPKAIEYPRRIKCNVRRIFSAGTTSDSSAKPVSGELKCKSRSDKEDLQTYLYRMSHLKRSAQLFPKFFVIERIFFQIKTYFAFRETSFDLSQILSTWMNVLSKWFSFFFKWTFFFFF